MAQRAMATRTSERGEFGRFREVGVPRSRVRARPDSDEMAAPDLLIELIPTDRVAQIRPTADSMGRIERHLDV